jgi:hypothetical protein
MNVPNLCRCNFGFTLTILCFLGWTALAGETKNLLPDLAQPFARPVAPPNSTFRTDLTLLPREDSPYQSEEEQRQRQLAAVLSARWFKEKFAVTKRSAPQSPTTALPAAAPADPQRMQPTESDRFQWKPALSQAMTFLWIEHAFRFATEPGTRAELRGPFFRDWWNSIKSTRGWRDGDPFIVNYVGHGMQGSVTNYIFVHNDPKSIKLEAEFSKAYFKSRLKALLFSTVYSTQFELGPLSEASLGNVGLVPTKTSRHPSAFVDLVVTPTVGTMWMMGEEALDRIIIKRLEDRVEHRVVRLLVRSFLNPSRSFANALRGRYPWYRDGRRL